MWEKMVGTHEKALWVRLTSRLPYRECWLAAALAGRPLQPSTTCSRLAHSCPVLALCTVALHGDSLGQCCIVGA
jgi:hypothetical protein